MNPKMSFNSLDLYDLPNQTGTSKFPCSLPQNTVPLHLSVSLLLSLSLSVSISPSPSLPPFCPSLIQTAILLLNLNL